MEIPDLHVTGSMWILWSMLTLSAAIDLASAIYLVEKKFDHQEGTNSLAKVTPKRKFGPPFSTDQDVSDYMELFGTDAMIWRCKNAIQPYWHWRPLPVVELYCEAVGSMKSVHWYHNGKKLKLGVRYKQSLYPHYHDGNYFSKWIDFRLRIYNANHKDAGVYTFEVIGKKGSKNLKHIYVDISKNRRRRKNKWHQNTRRRKKSTPIGHKHEEKDTM